MTNVDPDAKDVERRLQELAPRIPATGHADLLFRLGWGGGHSRTN